MTDAPSDRPSPRSTTSRRLSTPVLALVACLGLLGLGIRLEPMFDGEAFTEAWPTEDGYLMLTVARNMALGNGMSVSDGEIPTNGVQPLTTFLWAAAFTLVDADPIGGIYLVLWFELLVAIASAWLLWRLGLHVLGDDARSRAIAAVAAALWFLSPLTLHHTMNCLETGVYGLLAILVARTFAEKGDPHALWSIPRCLGVGVLLSAAFWARNDGVFLILAACLTYLYSGREGGIELVKARFGRALVFGATSVVFALPWLVFNQLRFDSIMPVSGRAESLSGSFGSNFVHVPAILVEYLSIVLAMPNGLETRWFVVAGSMLVIAAAATFAARRVPSMKPEAQSLVVLVSLYGGGLFLFYGFFFGAPWFVARYMFPLSPFLTLGTVASAFWLAGRMQGVGPALLRGAGVVAIVAALGLHARALTDREHMHFQVVRWTQQNVPDDVWMGAVQTGTLGYYHPRTINLDGKVNLEAYEALVEGRIHEYVVESPIVYLADWEQAMRDFSTEPTIAEHFEVVLLDPEKNLGVLKRRD